ncbi:RNA polymerase sigma factor [Rathayibacter soli]|uniref:RNA polymerase sigma factor n=1 Tax=Rathayibacter soli TaxID=3144168 RepID=UPI0027E3BC08|nr:RNA polymerase sigma factor [Glaciibacter superstes]
MTVPAAPVVGREQVTRAVDAVWRIESARIISTLVRMTGDISLAEECAGDALVEALEKWPVSGIPRNTGAWLTATAKRRAIDHWRRLERRDAKYAQIAQMHDPSQAPGRPELIDLDEPIDDDVLRLVFVSCHPVLNAPARVALTLRLLGGLTTEEIARAFLVGVATIAQRVVRAKRTLAAARVPFEVPGRDEFAARLGSVLEVVYLIFNEGYSATAGDDVMRPDLCQEAMRLGRVLARLVPAEPEVHGLVALMELQASRLGARADSNGDPVLLLDQDRARWDHLLISHGLTALARAELVRVRRGGRPLGGYTLQAEIAACHARSARASDTDWHTIAALYEALAQVLPSPVVELNRAIAVSMAYGPQAGLDIVDDLVARDELGGYHLLPAARADLLVRLGRTDEARAEFQRAAALTRNERERMQLLSRAESCG